VTSAIGDKAREAQAEKYEDAGLRKPVNRESIRMPWHSLGADRADGWRVALLFRTILSVEV